MATEIKAPVFPESVADGTIATWHKKVGEPVSRDEVICDIETDKVVLEVVAPADGSLVAIIKDEGDTVLSDEVIAQFEAGAGAAAAAPAAVEQAVAQTQAGAAPVVAEVAKEMGILTVGVVTTPFNFEGRRRLKSAERGIEALEAHVDSLIIIPNQRLLSVYGDISMKDAYKKADDVLLNAVRSIFDLVVNRGHINLDFADLKTAMSTRGYAMMGAGLGRGEDRARQAAEQAIRSPLLDNVNIINAKGVLINITGGDDITLRETEIITDVVNQIVDLDEGEIFYGTVFDPDARDELRVTVIATGLTRNAADAEPRKRNTVSHASSQSVQSVDEDDVPAINKRQNADNEVSSTASSTPRSSPMSIQDYLKNQQRK